MQQQPTSSTNSQQYDMAIVGGGMVGLALAQLAAHYLPHRRIVVMESFAVQEDKAPYQPSFDARSTAVSGGSMGILADIDLAEAIQQHATEIRSVHVSDRGHIGTTSFSREENNDQPLGFVVENAWLGRSLIKGLFARDNIEVIAPADVERIVPRQNGADVIYKVDGQQSTLNTQLVVVADGASSPLRKQLGIAVTTHDYHQHAVIANVTYDTPHKGVAYERFTADGPLALLPLGEGENANTSALVWTHKNQSVDSVLGWSDDEFIANLQKAFGYRLGRFTEVSKRHSYPLQLLVANEQVRSSMVLMGNAAHFLHPVAGQGFNLALRDSIELIKKLVAGERSGKGLGELSVLQKYIDNQYGDQYITSQMSHGFIHLFASDNPAFQLARNAGLVVMELMPAAKKAFFEQMMGKGLFNSRSLSK